VIEPTRSDGMVGMWRLAGAVVVRASGESTISQLGRNPTGIIVYDRSGQMAVQIMADPRALAEDAGHLSSGEPATMHQEYLAYAGTYHHDVGAGTVTHHVQMSLDRPLIGGRILRKVELDGDELTLIADWQLPPGDPATTRLTWRRVRRAENLP
jgi:hypothetical protein